MVPRTFATTEMDLAKIFKSDCIRGLSTQLSKAGALRDLVETLAVKARIPGDKADLIAAALIEREQFGTTGMGKGLAMPHLRSHFVHDFVGAIGVAPQGIDFNSLDGMPTRVVILLISPFEQREQHFAVMARVARLLSDTTLQYSLQLDRGPEELLSFLGFA